MLEELKGLLQKKQSNSWYAYKLGITEEEVKKLKKQIKKEVNKEIIEKVAEEVRKVNNESGTLESSIETTYEPKNDVELAELHHIDLTKYKISTYWSKLKSNGKFTSSVLASLKKEDSEDKFQENFENFLQNYKPGPIITYRYKTNSKPKVSLIIPKQDAHFNKFDIGGKNNIQERFDNIKAATVNALYKASSTACIEEVIYIVGSDQFNSEWTSTTTKFTPQQNILSYQDAFTAICNHEVEVINAMLFESESVKVVFVPGNHDEFVGWHLINWLESYYRDNKRVEFDSLTTNTKYHKYGKTAIMLNHGDDIKPKDLAHMFPIAFKDQWSSCDTYYIFCGDKHTELSADFCGIKFYRVPQLSSAKSKWDDKKGFIHSKAEMTSFVISKENGMTDIYKEVL